MVGTITLSSSSQIQIMLLGLPSPLNASIAGVVNVLINGSTEIYVASAIKLYWIFDGATCINSPPGMSESVNISCCI